MSIFNPGKIIHIFFEINGGKCKFTILIKKRNDSDFKIPAKNDTF